MEGNAPVVYDIPAVEKENTAYRSFSVSVFRPKAPFTTPPPNYNPVDDISQPRINRLEWKSRPFRCEHPNHDGRKIKQDTRVIGTILDSAIDSEGNVIGLHMNYGTKYGVVGTNEIKKGPVM